SDMPLRVLGGVKQKTDHGRRQLGAAHLAPVERGRRIGAAYLRERAIDRVVESREECRALLRRLSRAPLVVQIHKLFGRQRLAAGVREQAVKAADRVHYVICDGGNQRRTSGELRRRKPRKRRVHFFAALQQPVCDRLKEGRNVRQRSAEPDFGDRIRAHPELYRERRSLSSAAPPPGPTPRAPLPSTRRE